MNLLLLNPNFNSNPEKDPLSVFRKNRPKPTEIVQGMTPDEIAEIVSEKIINIIREQFKKTAEQLEQKSQQ